MRSQTFTVQGLYLTSTLLNLGTNILNETVASALKMEATESSEMLVHISNYTAPYPSQNTELDVLHFRSKT
jgi:hypothetical protein